MLASPFVYNPLCDFLQSQYFFLHVFLLLIIKVFFQAAWIIGHNLNLDFHFFGIKEFSVIATMTDWWLPYLQSKEP